MPGGSVGQASNSGLSSGHEIEHHIKDHIHTLSMEPA